VPARSRTGICVLVRGRLVASDLVATRDIRTSTAYTVCDVCGRTLLRGERAEVYLHGGERHAVCELCKSRALHEGWIKEGTMPSYGDGDSRSERRRSLLGRLRSRRDGREAGPEPAYELADPYEAPEPPPESPSPVAVPAPRRRERVREPRHVRAVPTSPEQKTASAVQLFNGSEHTRTVAGVARSLGLPAVSVLPSVTGPSLVIVVVSWELCWYRYEVDLSDEVPTVRVAGQGYELDELPAEERVANAVSDDNGVLALP
jgi:hypothetical protein